METRDYECDLQGIVNNANYLHYLEATRHSWMDSLGLSFSQWHEMGLDMVVSEIDIKYRASLKGREKFISSLSARRDGPRFVFRQEICRKDDSRLCVSATVTCAAVENGKLTRGDRVAQLLEQAGVTI